MNERIKLLIEQATTYVDPMANDGVCWDFDREKLAQLIVRECIGACLQDDWEDPRWGRFYANKIKQHFGVEE